MRKAKKYRKRFSAIVFIKKQKTKICSFFKVKQEKIRVLRPEILD